jgi:hypothetical protein
MPCSPGASQKYMMIQARGEGASQFFMDIFQYN